MIHVKGLGHLNGHYVFMCLYRRNTSISQIPCKWNDKANSPKAISLTFSARKSIGGNCCVIPLIIGDKGTEDDTMAGFDELERFC